MTTPVPDDFRVFAERLTRELSAVYAQAESALVATMGRIMAKHGGVLPSDLVARYQVILEMRQAAADTVDYVARTANPKIEQIVRRAAMAGEATAAAQLREAIGITPAEFAGITRVLPGVLAAESIALDLASKLSVVTSRVTRFADDAYRAATSIEASLAVLGAQTVDTANRNAWNRLMGRGISAFVDRSNRVWNLASYSEMAVRTSVVRAYQDASVQRLADGGINLVRVIAGMEGCDRCGPLANQILAVSGMDGPRRVTVQDALVDGRYVTVDVVNTIAGAARDGWRHPNCRCVLVGYFPGLPSPASVTRYDPVREKQRTDLRGFERKVRYLKRQVSGALTESDRAKFKQKIRDTQAAIRQHVKATGATRLPNRERTNLGYRER